MGRRKQDYDDNDDNYPYKIIKTREDELLEQNRILKRIIAELSEYVDKSGYDSNKIIEQIINES